MIKLDATVPFPNRFTLYAGETESVQVDYTNFVGNLGTTVSSVTWSIEGPVTTASESLSSGVASCNWVAGYSGYEIGKITATLADGDVIIHTFNIRVLDPDC